jgi:hypothetical protein
VEVGEVRGRAGRAVERGQVGGELHQVAGDEARGEPEMAEELHQEPAGVAAGTEGAGERLLAALDAGFHADRVLDLRGEALVQLHQEIHGPPAPAVHPVDPGTQARARLRDLETGRELPTAALVVGEGPVLGALLQEEIEGVDDREVRDEIHLEGQGRGALREHEAGEVVAEGILLPVQEVRLRRHPEREREHRRARMHRGAQPEHVRMDLDRPVEAVGGDVVERDVDGQAGLRQAGGAG